MPDTDEYSFMQQVRSLDQGQKIPATALTAYAGAADHERALAARFQLHLAKPAWRIRKLNKNEGTNCGIKR